jgi:4-hydroxy-3-methylbut-2-enyl diphosphate reductase
MTERTLEDTGEGSQVWTCGAIIHNSHVMDELKGRGLKVVSSLEEVPEGAAVIVRSHGEGPSFFEEAGWRGQKLIDATCVKVAEIHRLVAEAHSEGYTVVIIGDADHPEVRATAEYGGEAEVAASEEDAARIAESALKDGRKLFVVSQTTFDAERFASIAKALAEAGAEVRNTICNATALRQKACAELAEDVDAVVVIGDKMSSNTKKLYSIAEKHGKKACFVHNPREILLKDLKSYNRIGFTAGASTPEYVIEEVIAFMSEFNGENNEVNPMHEFMDEIDKSTRLPRNGDIITGEVIQVTDNDVTVSLGFKKDGVIPKNEISLEEGVTLKEKFKEGDEVQAKVLKNDDGEGNILLSSKRVIVSEHWETINQAYEDKAPLEVKVTREVNGGVIATFNEVNGFIPLSQLSDRYVEKADEFIGQELTVKVIRVDQKRNKVVFSHKAVLNEERQKRMAEIWDSLNVGDVIDGKVMRFTDYGAFVDIGGIDGLLHISEISWGKLRHPKDMLAIDQEIKVKILSMNKEKEKISLGYKQNQPEPWSVINEKYHIGQIISGKAVQLKDYGVFVEIEPGLDGLVHISEIAFRRVSDISDEIEVGQEVSAKILEIDSDRKRISLSIKEASERSEDDDIDDRDDRDEESGTHPGDPSTELFDPDRDQEHEMPDPDGVDAVPEHFAEPGDPSTGLFDPDRDQELEMPDPDGVDAVPEHSAEPGDPSTELFDPDRDQEFEMPDPDGVDAIPVQSETDAVSEGDEVELEAEVEVEVEIEAEAEEAEIPEEAEVVEEDSEEEAEAGSLNPSEEAESDSEEVPEEAGAEAGSAEADEAAEAAGEPDVAGEIEAHESGAHPGDPSTELSDPDKDQEFEMPDPDGIDAVPEASAEPGDPSTEPFDPDRDQEFEMPDPDGKDAE